MGCFFLNWILRKEHEERMQLRRKGERQRYSCSHINSHLDRLPDDILLHILSFMSTRDCVRSSTLAKRWRFLWARVPNLKFDSGDHKTLTSFSNFFNRFVFVHKGQNINTFRLVHEYEDKFEDEDDENMEGSENKFDDKDDEYMTGSEIKFEIETLIATAIACNVQVIEIHSDCEFVLPHVLFTCKTLVDLTLNCTCDHYEKDAVVLVVPMPGTTVYLPALKKLELRDFRYKTEESIVHLLSGCPALEELTIHKGVDNVVCVFVSSPTLTRLDFKIFRNSFGHDKANFEVKLDTPALKYLKLCDSLSKDFSTGMLASLTEADVDFSPFIESELYYRSILEFVSKLNSVTCLNLTLFLPKVLIDCALTTEFRNLTKLEFFGDLHVVTKFLENSDNLEVLNIDMFGKHHYWMEPTQVPLCLIHHLRTVRFRRFEYSEAGFNMVEYILRNSKVLKRVEIDVTYCGKKKSEARERISLFERASEACQLTLKFDL